MNNEFIIFNIIMCLYIYIYIYGNKVIAAMLLRMVLYGNIYTVFF